MKNLNLISSIRDTPHSRDQGEGAIPPGSASRRNPESCGPHRPSRRPFDISTVGLNSCRCAELLKVIVALPPYVTSSFPTLYLWCRFPRIRCPCALRPSFSGQCCPGCQLPGRHQSGYMCKCALGFIFPWLRNE